MDNRRMREEPIRYKAGLFLGITMTFCVMCMIVSRLGELEIDGVMLSPDDGPVGIISRLLLLAGGLAILFLRKKGNYFAVGLYALALGASRFIRTLPNLMSESDAVFYFGLIMIFLSANLAATGYNHLTVRMRNPLNMRYTTILMLFAYATVLLFFIYIGEKPAKVLNYFPDLIWYFPIYVALLAVLFSRDVANNSPMGRINTFSSQIADRTDLGNGILVSEEDAEKIREGFRGPEGWRAKEIGGTVVREEIIAFVSSGGSRDVVLERCEGDADLCMTIIGDKEDSFIDGRRMRVSSYDESDGTITLKDDMGVCAVLHIRGPQRWTSPTAGFIRIT